MNSAARTTFSLATGIAVLALNFTVVAPAEAQSVRAELLAGAERGHAQTRRSDHGSAVRHGRHDNRHHNRRHGGYHVQEYYYESDYYKVKQRKARKYANEAIAQAREARRLGFYPDHPRWSLNFDRHYRWALDRPPHKLEREHYERAAKLRELRAYHYGHYTRHDNRHNKRHEPYSRH